MQPETDAENECSINIQSQNLMQQKTEAENECLNNKQSQKLKLRLSKEFRKSQKL
jgi:hypothetical protein